MSIKEQKEDNFYGIAKIEKGASALGITRPGYESPNMTLEGKRLMMRTDPSVHEQFKIDKMLV